MHTLATSFTPWSTIQLVEISIHCMYITGCYQSQLSTARGTPRKTLPSRQVCHPDTGLRAVSTVTVLAPVLTWIWWTTKLPETEPEVSPVRVTNRVPASSP